jgi:hypothetical protein
VFTKLAIIASRTMSLRSAVNKGVLMVGACIATMLLSLAVGAARASAITACQPTYLRVNGVVARLCLAVRYADA